MKSPAASHGGANALHQAGTYTMLDSLHIRVPMTVRGAGETTGPQEGCCVPRVRLLQDFDLSEYLAVVSDASNLKPGMG